MLSAQGYTTALGLRAGTEIGLTLQQQVWPGVTMEGILQRQMKTEETYVTLLAEKHQKLLFRKFNLVLGGGVHKGWNTTGGDERITEDPAGVTGILGLGLTVGRINVGWDTKPAFNIVGGERFVDFQTAVSVRYVLVPQKKKRKDWKFWKKDGERKKDKKKEKSPWFSKRA